MWISFLEGVADLGGGRTGALDVVTRQRRRAPGGHGLAPRSPAIQQALAALRTAEFNFGPPDDALAGRPDGASTISARPCPPSRRGRRARTAASRPRRRLMRDYEFADPAVVRAYYDESEPLEGRTMLLVIRFRGLRFHAGVRVRDVYERTIECEGRPVPGLGLAYGTLVGHFEMGQMDWQVWKWLDTGEVQFRINAYSRRAPVRIPLVRLGFRVFGRRSSSRSCAHDAPHGRAHRAGTR